MYVGLANGIHSRIHLIAWRNFITLQWLFGKCLVRILVWTSDVMRFFVRFPQSIHSSAGIVLLSSHDRFIPNPFSYSLPSYRSTLLKQLTVSRAKLNYILCCTSSISFSFKPTLGLLLMTKCISSLRNRSSVVRLHCSIFLKERNQQEAVATQRSINIGCS